MKRRLASVLAAAALGVGMVGSMASPAHAAEVGVVVFVGAATTGALWSPTSPNCVNPTVPAVLCPANTVTWEFSSTVAGALSVGKKPFPGPVGANADLNASISAEGSLTGWCGRSVGFSTDGQVNASGKTFEFEVAWESAGSVLVLTGEATNTSSGQTGPIVAVVDAVPTTGSCLDGTATGFTVAGAALFAVV